MEVEMKIKRYMAASMRAALAQVRTEQGPDAVILSSRRGEDGIEVIAAVDYDEALFAEARQRSPAASPEPPIPAPPAPLQPSVAPSQAQPMPTQNQSSSQKSAAQSQSSPRPPESAQSPNLIPSSFRRLTVCS